MGQATRSEEHYGAKDLLQYSLRDTVPVRAFGVTADPRRGGEDAFSVAPAGFPKWPGGRSIL